MSRGHSAPPTAAHRGSGRTLDDRPEVVTFARYVREKYLPTLKPQTRQAQSASLLGSTGLVDAIGNKQLDEICALDAFLIAAATVARGEDGIARVSLLRRVLRHANLVGALASMPDLRGAQPPRSLRRAER
jgi:hypothetical protein